MGIGFRWAGVEGEPEGSPDKVVIAGGCSLMRQKTEPSMCNVEVTAYLAWGWGGRGVLGSLTCENFRQKRQKNGMAAGDPLKNQGEH